jgi:D-hexose-6-phosphate mutarotase
MHRTKAAGRPNLWMRPRLSLSLILRFRHSTALFYYALLSRFPFSTFFFRVFITRKQGFARVNKWKLESTYDTAEAAGAKYTLDFSHVTHGMGEHNTWAIDQATTDGTKCLLTYEVRITGTEMTNTLLVDNTGTSSFDFAALFHTYFAVDNGAAQDNTKTYVDGLGGYTINDRVSRKRRRRRRIARCYVERTS